MNTKWWYYYCVRVYIEDEIKSINCEGFLEAEDEAEVGARLSSFYGTELIGCYMSATDVQGMMDIVTQQTYLKECRDEFKKLMGDIE